MLELYVNSMLELYVNSMLELFMFIVDVKLFTVGYMGSHAANDGLLLVRIPAVT